MAITKQELMAAVSSGLENKDLSRQAAGVLKRAVEEVLKRIRQNVDAQVKEDTYPVVETFCKNIGNKLSSMSQQWVDVKNDMVIFPENTRYIFRDGSITSIVIEQQPQARTVSINGVNFLLSMPYVQFIIPFKDSAPQGSLYVGMTRKPISDLDEMIYLPVLPNILDHKVCTGDFKFPQKGTMTEKVNAIIGGFWQSAFNDSHLEAVTKFKSVNGLDYSTWQKKSKLDPTFILAKNISFPPGKTIRSLLAHSDGKNGSVALVNNMKTEITNAVGSIGADLQKLLTNIDLTTENREKTHIEVLQGVLKEIIESVYSELWEFLQQQLQQEKAKMQVEMEAAANKLKKDFQYYVETTGSKKWK